MKFQNDAERQLWLKVFEAFHSPRPMGGRRNAVTVAAKEADEVVEAFRAREPEPSLNDLLRERGKK